MTGRIRGATITGADGIAMDTPTQALDYSAADLMAAAEKQGHPLVMPERRVSRRLRCTLVIDPKERSLRAYGDTTAAIAAIAARNWGKASLCIFIDRDLMAGYTLDITDQWSYTVDAQAAFSGSPGQR